MAIVNLESPLIAGAAPAPAKDGPALTADVGFASFLSASGVTAVTLANNHIMDAGTMGLESTRSALRDACVRFTGAAASLTEAREPLLLSTPAGVVGILAVSEGEFSAASADSGGAAPLDEAFIVAALGRLATECVFTVLVYHGGNERYRLPSPEMVRRCRAFAEAGADAVVCHHAHVVSGYEVHGTSLIAYSLGNLMMNYPSPREPLWNTGALLSLRIRPNELAAWRLIGTEQGMGVPGVALAGDGKRFDELIAESSAVISDPAALRRAFADFCDSSRVARLATLFSLTRPERILLRRGVYPWWRVRRSELVYLLNLFQCESHREVVMEVLREELKGGR